MKPINISKKNMTKNITYHDNGNICEESFYKDGKRNGECTTYYENGDKELVGYFKNGLLIQVYPLKPTV